MPTAPTLTSLYRQLLATAPLYDDSLGAGDLHQVYLAWEIDTDPGFASPIEILVPTRRSTEAADYITGGPSETDPPLDDAANIGCLEEARLNAPANGTWQARYKYQRWIGGSLDSESAFSSSGSTTIAGATAAAFAGDHEPVDEPSKLTIVVSVGRTRTDLTSVDTKSFSAVALEGPDAHASRVQAWIDKGLTASYAVDSPFGQERAIQDLGANSTIPIRFPHGKVDESTYLRTSLLRPADCRQAGTTLGGATGAAMEAMVDDFKAAWSGLNASGVRVLYYGAPPIDFRQDRPASFTDDNLLGLVMAAGMVLCFDSIARANLTDPNTGEPTPLKDFLDWWQANVGSAIYAEPGLRIAAKTDLLDTYSFIHTLTLFDDVFDDAAYAADRTLTRLAAAVDPASYADRTHVIWGQTNVCQRLADAAAVSDAAKAEAFTLYVEDICALGETYRAWIGPDTSLIDFVTGEQINRMNAAAALSGAVGSAAVSEITEASADIFDVIETMGATVSATVRIRAEGVLNTTTGARTTSDTDVAATLIKVSGQRLGIPIGGRDMEAQQTTYYAEAADFDTRPDENDLVIEGSETRVIADVSEAFGGAVLVLTCVDQQAT